MSDLTDYLHAVYGDRTGFAHLAVGTGPHVAAGKFKHHRWTEAQFHWPGEETQLVRAIQQERAAAGDVYVCPYLMHGRKRAQGAAAARPLVHADVDGAVPLDKVRELGGFVIGSGTEGHGHVYVPLTESVPAHWHRALCIGLRDHLGDADAKISDNDVLRPPGTSNNKPVAFGTGEPAPVTWLVRPSGTLWEPHKLAEALGVALPATAASTAPAAPTTAETVDIARLPQRIRDALALNSGDRSADTMRIVGACHTAGLALAQTRYVVNDRKDLRTRLAERHDDDVLTCWLKATDSRNTQRQADEWVESIDAGAPDGTPDLTDEDVEQRLFAQLVAQEAGKLRVRAAARAQVDAEQRAAEPAPAFDAGTLAEVLARPAEPPHRAEGLIPSEASTLIVAQRKTGKTTLELCLARSLIAGDDFLGRFPVRQIAGRVGFLNFEVSAGQLARWARDLGIPQDRLYLVNLRGRRNPLSHPEDRATLAAALREQQVESLIVDPFGRAYGGQSQNDSGEVGAWLTDLDYFARGEVGAVDLVLSAHAGWNGERTRGSSALEDWADSIITLTRDAEDDSVRYLRAMGRDVEVDEDRLSFDPFSRLLSMTGAGSRKAVAKVRHLDDLVPAVVQVVKTAPGITGYKLKTALREAGHSFQRGDEIKAAALAVDRGLLRFEPGPRNSKQYFAATETPTYPDLPRPTPAGDVLTYPDLPLSTGGGQQRNSEPDLPRSCSACESLASKGITSGCADHYAGPVAS
jgi:hypothetical protein